MFEMWFTVLTFWINKTPIGNHSSVVLLCLWSFQVFFLSFLILYSHFIYSILNSLAISILNIYNILYTRSFQLWKRRTWSRNGLVEDNITGLQLDSNKLSGHRVYSFGYWKGRFFLCSTDHQVIEYLQTLLWAITCSTLIVWYTTK